MENIKKIELTNKFISELDKVLNRVLTYKSIEILRRLGVLNELLDFFKKSKKTYEVIETYINRILPNMENKFNKDIIALDLISSIMEKNEKI